MRRGADHIDQVVLFAVARGQLAKDVLHHDHRAVHQDAEVDRADRQQIGGNMAPVQADEREHQRKWNGQRYDQRRARA